MKRVAAVLAGAAFFALAGCSGMVLGKAEPVAQAGSALPSGSAVPENPSGQQVPKVEHPIDITRSSRLPCTALTAQQISELLGDAAPGTPGLDRPAGPACYWGGDAAHGNASVDVIFTAVDKLGLTSVYQAAGPSRSSPKPLRDFPAGPTCLREVGCDARPCLLQGKSRTFDPGFIGGCVPRQRVGRAGSSAGTRRPALGGHCVPFLAGG